MRRIKKTPVIWRSREYCLKCGRCCKETQMLLLKEDLERLTSLGFRVEDFAVKEGKLYRLRNVDGFCYFYDKKRRICRVYDYRPLGCSLYPIVIDVDSGSLTLDDYCPLADTTRMEELKVARIYVKKILSELSLLT